MEKIRPSDLQIGHVTAIEYYGPDGELLLAKGVIVTERHLAALRRRNIFELHAGAGGTEQDEIEAILSKDLADLDDLDLGEAPSTRPRPAPPEVPKALELPELQNIREGREGLAQLVGSKTAIEVDRNIERKGTPDRPARPPLRDRMTQIEVGIRTPDYKDGVVKCYHDALGEARTILNSLADAARMDQSRARFVIERFMQTLLTDRNILLGITGTRNEQADYLYTHSLNVSLLSMVIASSAGYSEGQVIEIGMGGLLHDVGMFLVPRSVQNGRHRLSSDGWFEVQKHPVLGLHLLERVKGLPDSVPIVAYQTHERENGRGYPRQRRSRFIHCFAKIVALADIYEAVSSPRPYREAMPPYAGTEMLVKMARQGLVSGEFVRAFLNAASLFPIGSLVGLSDGRTARVVGANGRSYTKPIVSVLVDENGKELTQEQIYQLDLKDDTDVQIELSHRLDFLPELGALRGF